MKKLLSLFKFIVLVCFLCQIISCKKDPTPATTVTKYPIQGLWIGTYTVDGQDKLGAQYFSFIIKPDGTLIADTKGDNQQHLSVGTYTLNGSTLNCTFTCVYGIQSNIGITETSTATWDKTGKLLGTWKNIPQNSGSGIITLTRVN